jgi:site-specific DNA recombinase
MLSNPIYVGRQVFNKHAFVRDPDTGTRRARAKDQDEWVEAAVPELAIIDEVLWQQVQERIAATPLQRPEQSRRPKRLFSGLVKCGVCGGNLTIVQKDRYGCMEARQKGTCTNNRSMKATDIEARVLDGLRDRLMEPKLVQAFVDEYHSELERLQKDARRRHTSHSKERASLERQIARLVDAIAEGSVSELGAVGEKLRDLEGRLSALPVFNEQEPQRIEWHPNAVNIYKQKVADLSTALSADDVVHDEAAAALRNLVDKIVAHPGEKRGQFELELHGQLAGALNLAKYGNGGGGRRISKLPAFRIVVIKM